MQKNSKSYEQKITNIAKTQFSEAIKIISYYPNDVASVQIFRNFRLNFSQFCWYTL